jgi:HAD superfamily hydrolase (TIGR01509 family)
MLIIYVDADACPADPHIELIVRSDFGDVDDWIGSEAGPRSPQRVTGFPLHLERFQASVRRAVCSFYPSSTSVSTTEHRHVGAPMAVWACVPRVARQERTMQRLNGVLLDVDGTLIDSNDAHARAWVIAFTKHGIDVPFERVRPLIGKGSDKLLPEAAGLAADSAPGKAVSKSRTEIFQREFLPHLRPFPRVQELLARMKADGLRLAVASSAKGGELDGLLRACGADKFIEAKTSSDDAENSKPDPDIVEAALKQVELPPTEVLLLGDTPYDVQAAVHAGVRVVALRCGGWSDADLRGATAIYDDPADLLHRYADSPFGART